MRQVAKPRQSALIARGRDLPSDCRAASARYADLRDRRRANWGELAEVSDDGIDDIALLDESGEKARFE